MLSEFVTVPHKPESRSTLAASTSKAEELVKPTACSGIARFRCLNRALIER
jgi:hypothetical protein